MKAILVFIDGTICDTRPRHHLFNTSDFFRCDRILADQAVPGSIECLKELSKRYEIVYMGARPEFCRSYTEEWLRQMGYPNGDIYLAEEQEGRLRLLEEIMGRFDFVAGIGDRWDDNELHVEMDCLSIILQEYEGRWDKVAENIDKHCRKRKAEENRIHLRGKVEGLARVCPLLLSRYGEQLWETYHGAVMEMAEASRETRRAEDLASFAKNGLDPNDLKDAAKWDMLSREEDWENDPAYGLQSFELVEATQRRYVHKITSCFYADLWKNHGRTDIGYQIHCRTDMAWWDRPAWNSNVRFEQPQTIMLGDDCCLFVQSLPDNE